MSVFRGGLIFLSSLRALVPLPLAPGRWDHCPFLFPPSTGSSSPRPTSWMEQVGPGSRIRRMTVKTEEDGATQNWLYEWDPLVVVEWGKYGGNGWCREKDVSLRHCLRQIWSLYFWILLVAPDFLMTLNNYCMVFLLVVHNFSKLKKKDRNQKVALFSSMSV